MKTFRTSNDVLDDLDARWARFAEDGYLFFRDVLDVEAVTDLKHAVTAVLVEHGYATVVDDEPIWTGADLAAFGTHPAALHRELLWEQFVARPSIAATLERILGEPAFFVPIAQYQFTWPKKGDRSIIHQDHYYNPGMRFHTFWIPLMEIPEEVGGLMLAPRMHTQGPLHDESDAELAVPMDRVPRDGWYRADYRPGDLLVFHGLTPHAGMPNRTNRLRLSVDVRAQPASVPRPTIGTVTHVEADAIHVAGPDGEVRLAVDNSTLIRSDEPRREGVSRPVDLEDFVGRTVIAVTADGRTVLLRWPSYADG